MKTTLITVNSDYYIDASANVHIAALRLSPFSFSSLSGIGKGRNGWIEVGSVASYLNKI